jgi:hypothetical protein
MANTLRDYVTIVAHLKGNDHMHRAYAEMLKLDISTNEDINLLINSNSVRFRHVGWYLAGRKHLVGH